MKKFLCTILALSLAITTILQFDIDVIKANQQAYEDALPSVIGNPSNYTNEAIQLTVEEDAYLYSFSNDMIDYEWQHSNVSRYYGDNQDVYVTVMDESGNISPTRKVEITKIDRTKPSVNVNVDDSTLADGKVVIKAISNDTQSNVDLYSFDKGKTWQESNTYVLDNDEQVFIQVKDKAGNVYVDTNTYKLDLDDDFPILIKRNDEINEENKMITTIETISSQSECQYRFNNSKTFQDINKIEIEDASSVNVEVQASSKARTILNASAEVESGNYPVANAPLISFENGLVEILAQGNSKKTTDHKMAETDNGSYIIDAMTHYTLYSFDKVNWYSYTQPFYLEPNQYGKLYAKVVGIEGFDGYVSEVDTKATLFDGMYEVNYFTLSTPKMDINVSDYYDVTNNSYSSMIDSRIESNIVINNYNPSSYALYKTHESVNAFTLYDIYGGKQTFLYQGTNESKDIYKNNLDVEAIVNDTTTTIIEDEITYIYENNKLTKIKDSLGNTFSITRSTTQTTISDHKGNTYTYKNNKWYDLAGNSIQRNNDASLTYVDASGVSTTKTTQKMPTITLDEQGRVSKITNQNGSYVEYDYDIETINKNGTNAYYFKETTTDEKGQTTTSTYNKYYSLISYVDENGEESLYEDSIDACLISITLDKQRMYYVYDANDNLIKIKQQLLDANGNVVQEKITNEYSYDSEKRVIREKADDTYTYYTYDANDNVLIEAVLKEEYNTSAPAQYVASDASKYDTTTYAYNSDGSIKSETTSEAQSVNTYNSKGVLANCKTTSLINENESSTTWYGYDSNLNRIKETNEDGTNLYTFDQAGNLIYSNENGIITRYIYNNSNQLIQQINHKDYDESKDGLFATNKKDTYSVANVGLRYTYDTVGNLITETNEENKTITHTYTGSGVKDNTRYDKYLMKYDEYGNLLYITINNTTHLVDNTYSNDSKKLLTRKAYANQQYIDYTYNDDLLATIKFNGNLKYTYKYDDYDTLTKVLDHSNATRKEFSDGKTIVYDTSSETGGNVIYECDQENNIEKVLSNTYAMEELEDSELEVNGNTYTYENHGYKRNDALKAIVSDKMYLNGNLHLRNITNSNEQEVFNETYVYENGNAKAKYFNSIGTNNTQQLISYLYDGQRRITKEFEIDREVWYKYNDKGELIKEFDGKNDQVILYNYDDRGNITSKQSFTSSDGTTIEGNNKIITYGYSNSNWEDQLTSYDGKAIIYDAQGNRLTYDGYNYTWEGGRRLTKISNGSNVMTYRYDEDGIRTSKIVNGVQTKFTHINGQITSARNINGTLYFQYDDFGNLTGFINNDTQYFYMLDLQGDVIGITDTSGAVIVRYEYDAYGNLINMSGNTTLGNLNPMRYRSYYYDSESGYYYLQSRYYDPQIGRFINADEPDLLELTSSYINGANLYCYCGNDPINNVDFTGAFNWSNLWSYVGTLIDVISMFLPRIIQYKGWSEIVLKKLGRKIPIVKVIDIAFKVFSVYSLIKTLLEISKSESRYLKLYKKYNKLWKRSKRVEHRKMRNKYNILLNNVRSYEIFISSIYMISFFLDMTVINVMNSRLGITLAWVVIDVFDLGMSAASLLKDIRQYM